MKHNFRILIGMLMLAIPLCINAQVNPKKPKPAQKPEQEINHKQAESTMDQSRPTNSKVRPFKQSNNIKSDEPKKGAKPAKPANPNRPDKEGQNGNESNKTDNKEPKVGLEMPKISGFVQGMYQADLNGDGALASNTFRMRRVRLSVDGTLFKGLTYKIQGDFSRSPMLVDAYLKYKVCNEFAIQVGQFKTPFSLESPINPVNLEIFDYGESVQKLVGYSDVCGVGSLGRDLGIMATGGFVPMKDDKGIYNIVDYAIGVFNGNGANVLDNNNRKDIVGRLEVHPGLKDLTLSGSYYYGKYKKDDINQGTRNRWSVGAQYNNGDLIIRAEYLNGLTGYQVAAFNDTIPVLDEEGNQVFTEALRNSKGYYAVAGYNFKFGKEGHEQKLMPVLRYEHFEPGDMAPEVFGSTNFYTVGINYWPLKSVNFKLDYSLVQKVVGVKSNSHRVVAILSYKF